MDDNGRNWVTVNYLSEQNRYVVKKQPKNLLFGCVKSLLLLWKPCSWFQVNLKTFYHT